MQPNNATVTPSPESNDYRELGQMFALHATKKGSRAKIRNRTKGGMPKYPADIYDFYEAVTL